MKEMPNAAHAQLALMTATPLLRNRAGERVALLARLLVAATVTTVAVGCAENDSSLYVEGVLAPDSPSCEYSDDPGSAMLFRGTLDVAFRSKYEGIVLVGNQLAPRGNKAELDTETSGLRIRGSEVELTTSTGEVIQEFSVNSGGFVESNTSTSPGFGLAEVTMIPPAVGRDLAGELDGNRSATRTLIANIRVFGETLGGVEITSGDFTFPIDVCWGCLVEYPLEALDPMGNTYVCGAAGDGVALEQCRVGQDERIDCRACSSTLAVCFSPD